MKKPMDVMYWARILVLDFLQLAEDLRPCPRDDVARVELIDRVLDTHAYAHQLFLRDPDHFRVPRNLTAATHLLLAGAAREWCNRRKRCHVAQQLVEAAHALRAYVTPASTASVIMLKEKWGGRRAA